MFCIHYEDYILQREHLIEARSADTNVIGCAETTCVCTSVQTVTHSQPQATNLHQKCHKILQLQLTESLRCLLSDNYYISDALDCASKEPKRSFVFAMCTVILNDYTYYSLKKCFGR